MAGSQSPLILVIEDEESTRYALTWALNQGEYRVAEAASGAEGLAKLALAPDLVILDVRLPDMSGFTVCEMIKADPKTASIPVLHMSAAYSTSAHRSQGLEVGADAYLIHPVETPELLATVKALLRVRKSEAQATAAATLWESTFNAIQDGVCVLDSHGQILRANGAFFELMAPVAVGDNIHASLPHFASRLSSDASDEIKHLERYFTMQSSALDNSGLVCTFRDVTDKVAAEKEILQAKRYAEAANQSKSRFLANMSHEIRTPLGAIIGFAELLQASDNAGDTALYTETILRNGRNLNALIDDILDLSKVEAEKMEFEHEPTDILELMNDLKASFGLQVVQKKLQLDITFDADVPLKILTDSVRLRQVLTNIVGNAVKFTASGSIHIQVSRSHQQLLFDVMDSGRGIASEDIQKLFQPFSQGDSTTTREYGGTGLGLILSKQLARGLGGDVTLLSSSLGRGSIFRIAIALETANRPATVPRVSSESETRFNLTGKKILVVDDSPDNRLLLKRILTKNGAEVRVAENGEIALRSVDDIDAVLLDIQMPVMDGYDAARALRAQGYQGPIIALTAHAMPEERSKCLAIGCSDYLTKPIEVRSLLTTLTSQLTTH